MSEYIFHGDPMPENITEGSKSLGEFIIRKLKSHGDQVLLTHCITDEKVSASELLQKSIQVAKALAKYGIKAGDCVAIICDNRFEFIYVQFGTFLLGAFLAPINSIYIETEIINFFNQSKPRIVFSSTETLDKIINVTKSIANIKSVVVFGEDGRCESFDNFLGKHFDNDQDFQCASQDIETTTAVVLPTSGTTGHPKLIEITQKSTFGYISARPMFAKMNIISVLQFCYTSSFFCNFTYAIFGVNNVVMPEYEEHTFLKCIEKYKISWVYLPLEQMHMLATSPSIFSYDLSSLEYIITGGTVIYEWIVDQVYKRTNVKLILRGYGATEIGRTHFQSSNQSSNSRHIGMLTKGASAKIVNPDTGSILGPNQAGEILCKSPCQMKAYINNPDETMKAFDEHGFYRTGDLGYYDENGEWFFIERIKESIRYHIYDISPSELDEIIMTHPHVCDACVIGIPDEKYMALLMAFVVTDGTTVFAKEIEDYVAKRVSPAKYLRGGVKFITKIPRNTNGKPLRRTLKKEFCTEQTENLKKNN